MFFFLIESISCYQNLLKKVEIILLSKKTIFGFLISINTFFHFNSFEIFDFIQIEKNIIFLSFLELYNIKLIYI